MKVKDPTAAAQKFVQRGQAAGPAYKAGVTDAGNTWATNTASSADAYAAGVQASIGRGAFQKGVAKSGPAKYQARASGVGADRYPQGIAQAGPAWQAGVTPYLATLSSLTLSPRRPKGDPGNMQRAQEVAMALRAKKVSG